MDEATKGQLSISQRKCRFPEENEILKIYSNYTKSGCLMECKIDYALRTCGCIPWDFPHFTLNDPTCDEYGTTCFERCIIKFRSKTLSY